MKVMQMIMTRPMFFFLLVGILFCASCDSDDKPEIDDDTIIENPLDEFECPVAWDGNTPIELGSKQDSCYSVDFTFNGSFDKSMSGISDCFAELRFDEQFIFSDVCDEEFPTAINFLSFDNKLVNINLVVTGEVSCNGTTFQVQDTINTKMTVVDSKIYFDVCE